MDFGIEPVPAPPPKRGPQGRKPFFAEYEPILRQTPGQWHRLGPFEKQPVFKVPSEYERTLRKTDDGYYYLYVRYPGD